MPLGQFLGLSAGDAREIQAVLLGGYGGGWLSTAQALAMPMTEEEARRNGSSLGAGVVVLLPAGVCPLAEVGRVARYMEGEGPDSAGRASTGWTALARGLELLAYRPRSLCGAAPAHPDAVRSGGRAGCLRHPDGVARFVRTALRVFDVHAQLHLRRGPCHGGTHPFLPVPAEARRPVRSGGRR